MAYFILNDDRFEILDRIVEVIVSETHSGRIYLHIRRHRTRAVGVNVETDEALVELYQSSSGASRCVIGPIERWVRRIVEGMLVYNPYDDVFALTNEHYLVIVPDEARGIRPPREIPAVDGYVPMAWESPHTREDVFFYEHIDLGKPTATVFVRARRSDPLALWKRVEAAVQDIFDVEHVFYTRAGWGHEIFTLWSPRLQRRHHHVVRLLGSTWRVWPVSAYNARRLDALAEQLPLEEIEDLGIQYALAHNDDQLCGLARRRGWYIIQRID